MQRWLLYMDCCCFNRPYDDLSEAKVRLESESIMTIIDLCEQHDFTICGSDVLIDEFNRTVDKVKLEKVLALYSSTISETIELYDEIIDRASDLIQCGIKPFDALHVASAEYAKVDVFLTVDNKLLNAMKRAKVSVLTKNPAAWLLEVLYNEQ